MCVHESSGKWLNDHHKTYTHSLPFSLTANNTPHMTHLCFIFYQYSNKNYSVFTGDNFKNRISTDERHCTRGPLFHHHHSIVFNLSLYTIAPSHQKYYRTQQQKKRIAQKCSTLPTHVTTSERFYAFRGMSSILFSETKHTWKQYIPAILYGDRLQSGSPSNNFH